jgi:serine/threonine protein kinase
MTRGGRSLRFSAGMLKHGGRSSEHAVDVAKGLLTLKNTESPVKDEVAVPSGLDANPSASFDPLRSRLLRPKVDAGDTQQLPSISMIPEPVTEMRTSGSLRAAQEHERAQPIPVERSFELDRVIGRGGMGEVWAAKQTSLGRTIAVKRIRSDISGGNPDDPEWREVVSVFRHEAFTTGKLEHPNIVPVYDYANDGSGMPSLAMKLVRGKPWNEIILEDCEMPAPDFLAKHLQILIAMAQAVAFAHSRGVVHRDLKPSQVMVGEFGETLLMDWGLSISWDDPADPTNPGAEPFRDAPSWDLASSPSGTPAYMAPEQTESTARHVGPWTDVYMLGATLYYLLTRTVVHQADSARAAFIKAASGVVEHPAKRAPNREIPHELADLVMSALAADTRNRMQTAREFINGIQDYISGAGRRREAISLVDQSREKLKHDLTEYRAFNEVLAMLDKARTLWLECPDIAPLREQALVGYAKASLANGDLVLAALQAENIGDDDVRSKLQAEIRSEESRRAAMANSRRNAFIAVAILLVILTAGFFTLREVAASERQAQEREAEQRQAAELFARLNSLRDREVSLASTIGREVPLPEAVAWSRSGIANELSTTGAMELLRQRDELRKERRSLREEKLLSSRVGEEPWELLIAEGNLRLLSATNTKGQLDAYEVYREASQRNPARPEPMVGMAVAAARAGFFTTSTMLLENASKATLDVFGSKHPAYARVLAMRGEVLLSIDKGSNAPAVFYEESRSILEPQYLDMLKTLGNRAVALGEVEQALEYTSQAVELAERRYSKGSVEYIRAVGDYARVLSEDGREAEAKELHVARNEIRKEHFPDDIGLYIDCESTISDCDEHFGNYQASLDRVRPLIAAVEPNKEEMSGDYYVLLGRELKLLILLDQMDEAEALAHRMLNDGGKELGTHHPMYTDALLKLGEVYLNTGRHAEAEKILRDIIRIRSNDGAYADATVLAPMISLASALSYQDKDVEAEKQYRETIKVATRLRGAENVLTLSLMNNFAAHLATRERHREALAILLEMTEPLAKAITRDHPNMGVIYLNLMPSLARCGEWDAGELAGKAGLAVFRSRLGDQHQFTKRAVGRFVLNQLTQIERSDTPPSADFMIASGLMKIRQIEYPRFYSERGLQEDAIEPPSLVIEGLMRLVPPRPDLAKRLMRRVIASTRAVDFATTEPLWTSVIEPRARELGVEFTDPALKLPEELHPSPEHGIPAPAFQEWLNTIEAPIDPATDLPEVDVSLDAISGDVNELIDTLFALIEEMKPRYPDKPDVEPLGSDTSPAN